MRLSVLSAIKITLPAAALIGSAVHASAQSATEELVDDLPVRPLLQVLSEDSPSLIPKLEYTFSDGTIFSFTGQLNSGLLYYDDGVHSYANAPVNNDNSSSRARLELKKTVNDWLIHGTFEVEYQPLATNVVNQFDNTPNWDFEWTNVRKLEVVVGNEKYGKLWIGQGSMASDNIAEVDLSGTSIIAYSSISDVAGGYYFTLPDGMISDTQISSAFKNYDGFSRKVRIRYDTPTYMGFGLRTSYGQDVLGDVDDPLYDIAATYRGEHNDFVIAGDIGLAYNATTETTMFSGSASVLHDPSGVSLTFAAGQQNAEDLTSSYGFVKLGYQHDFFEFGRTYFSADYYRGSDIAGDGSKSTSYALAAVQDIDRINTQLWFVWRNYDFEDDSGEFRDGNAILTGALFKW